MGLGNNNQQQPIKALVLSGGDVRGAFQAGAIQGLLERGFHPHIIQGISAGALNGSFLTSEAGRMMKDGYEIAQNTIAYTQPINIG